MEIGDWKATAGMAEIYRQARALGLEANLAELEAFGFTVIEPEKTGAPAGFAERLLDQIKRVAAEEDTSAVELNKHADRPAFGRQLFHLLRRDPVFVEAAMNPVVRIMGSYLMGQSFRLSSMVAFVKEGPTGSTHMHTDSVGVPTPLPAYGSVCNVSWILTDYTVETGTLGMVPGSHRFCRHPTALEQPKFLGGGMEDDMVAPVVARPGSIAVFTGNTWHCTYPKTSEELRCHIATAFCRNYINPAENYDDLDPTILQSNDPELARLLGRDAWQGYQAEGPVLKKLRSVSSAYQSQYG